MDKETKNGEKKREDSDFNKLAQLTFSRELPFLARCHPPLLPLYRPLSLTGARR